MSTANFIPTLWSARLLAYLDKASVFTGPGVMNRDYEGTIATMGDTVVVGQIGAITIKPYTKNAPIAAPDATTSATQSLVIDQGDYFNFAVDDVDARQAAVNLVDGAMARAAYGMRDNADKYIAGFYSGAAAWAGTVGGGTALASPAAAYEALVDLGIVLDDQNAPTEDRFVIVPPWFHGVMRKDDRFVKYDAVGLDGGAALLNGLIGSAAGFKIFKSNNVAKSAAAGNPWQIIGGHPVAWTFADQIDKTEAYRPPDRFADAVKGLHIYGAKVVLPKALALLSVLPPAGQITFGVQSEDGGGDDGSAATETTSKSSTSSKSATA